MNKVEVWLTYMRVRVNMDVTLPLKCYKRIKRNSSSSFTMHFWLRHVEKYCDVLYNSKDGIVAREWGPELKVADRCEGSSSASRGFVDGRKEKEAGLWSQPETMIVLSWNYRGLGQPAIVQALCEHVKARRLDAIFLFETLALCSRLEEIRVKLSFDACLVVDCIGHSGGLAVLWKNANFCSVLS
ncbi:hypothetical protein ACS0TY_020445 [Phlomoides rotata]